MMFNVVFVTISAMFFGILLDNPLTYLEIDHADQYYFLRKARGATRFLTGT